MIFFFIDRNRPQCYTLVRFIAKGSQLRQTVVSRVARTVENRGQFTLRLDSRHGEEHHVMGAALEIRNCMSARGQPILKGVNLVVKQGGSRADGAERIW